MRTIIKEALTNEEVKKVFLLRKDVFVNEQKMFSHTDMDEHDNNAHYLIAFVDGIAVGTVRVYSLENNDIWEGGRLAVKKEYRRTNIGGELVREAVKYVSKRGAMHFSAKIQKDNIVFFKKLGWTVDSQEFFFRGRHHVRMVSNISQLLPAGAGTKKTSLSLKGTR